ncbi:MAG: hypothetical protein K6G94_03575 [Kiritimatiellae bacterium]|nr:hypothetical protein [Kiritimatiellia bacterium]
MSSTTYHIHGARYLRKYTAAERSSCYSYMNDVRKIANTLCKVPWTLVKSDVAAMNTFHSEESLDWNEKERDRFDAAEWCADHDNGMHRAFAQAACYVFRLPDGAIGTAIESIKATVTSDPYNPYGARISAMTSATLDIPMDCATVRQGEVYRAPDENGMGAAPRLYVEAADGTQTWYANTETVELEPQSMTAKRYLFLFVCLENYNRGREGWIEGSSYIDNNVEITFADAVSGWNSNGEVEDCSSVGVFEIRYYDDVPGMYSVLDTIPAKETVKATSYNLGAIAVFGTPTDSDCGIIPGLTLISNRSDSQGTVLKGTGACPVSVDPDSIVALNAFSYSSVLRISLLCSDGWVRHINGVTVANDGTLDYSEATISDAARVCYDISHAHIYNTSETSSYVLGLLASGDIIWMSVSSDGVSSKILPVSGGEVVSMFNSSVFIFVFGTFTALGDTSVSGGAVVRLDQSTPVINGMVPGDGLVLDNYNVRDCIATVNSSDFISNPGVHPTYQPQVATPFALSGDFTTINGKRADGFAAVHKDGSVRPLARENFVMAPILSNGGYDALTRVDYHFFLGMAIVDTRD